MQPHTSSITRFDESKLVEFIGQATRRLVYMAPGMSTRIAKILSEKWKSLGTKSVEVILDVDPEVARMGYGTLEALTQLHATAAELGAVVNCQPGIRIGIIVADDKTLIFAPTPLLIEAGSNQPFHPNAIYLDTLPATIAADLGLGEKANRDRTVGLDAITPNEIKDITTDLEQNPPVKFDVARKVRVFNAHFEFVELELRGGLISRRRVPIPSDLMGLAKEEKAQRLLKSTFQLIDGEGPLSSDQVNRLKELVVRRYLILLPGYGWVVLRRNKPQLEKAVGVLEKYIERYQRRITKRLQDEIDANRSALAQALFPAVRRNPPQRWLKFIGVAAKDEDFRRMLDSDLRDAFGSADEALRKIELRLVFKGVTYELLNDPKFMNIAASAIPSLASLHTEFDAATVKQN